MDGPTYSEKPTPELLAGVTKLAAGVDWSGGGNQGKSTTALVILGRLASGRLRVLYFKVFAGTHAVEENEEIVKVLKAYDVGGQLLVGGDAGEGNMNMDMLRSRLANPQRVVKFRYSGTSRAYVSWDKTGNFFTVHRTTAIDSCMMAFLRKEFSFPKEPEGRVRAAFKHILAEYEETTSIEAGGRKTWRHADTNPDDFLHGCVFARLAIQIAVGEVNLGSEAPK